GSSGSRDPEGYWSRMSLAGTERDVAKQLLTPCGGPPSTGANTVHSGAGARIAGQTAFQRVPMAGDAGQSFHLVLEHNDDPPVMSPAIRLDRAGQFDITGVRPGWYVLTAAGLPAGWEISSALLGERDI